MQGILEISGPMGGRRVILSTPSLGIGRADDNDVILDDVQASRYHTRIEQLGAGFQLTDLGSGNGTRINGVLVPARSPCLLHDGDTISIGHHVLQFRVTAPDVESTLREAPPAMDAERTLLDEPAAAADDTPTLLDAPPVAVPASRDPGLPVAAAAFQTALVQSVPFLLVEAPLGDFRVPLAAPVLTLGRGDENDIVVDDRAVSRRHAELRRVGDGYVINDLGSSNGLLLRGEPVTQRRLEDGDLITIGTSVTLTFHQPDAVAGIDLSERRLDLRDRDQLLVGRLAPNDLVLDHPTVSRFHARIVRRPDGQGYTIEDLDSANGTFLNGDRIAAGQPRPLSVGDTIRIGLVKLVYAPDALEQTDESHDLRLDALHLNQRVRDGLNLLQDISLAIPARAFVAIVGVSGAGKSTLLTALSGFRPAQGLVLINGEDLYRNFDAWRTTLGFVPQDDIIHMELPVERALDYAAQLRLPSDTNPAERRQRVHEVMRTLGLLERRDLPVRSLSGGQRKRVSMGVELLTEPGLIFLDEATSGLDPGTELQMMRLLRRLANDGHTTVLITHATKNVAMCDQVVFLAKGGHVAWYGTPADALTYFEVEDFDAIYEKLEEQLTPEAWAERYRGSPYYRANIAGPLHQRYGAAFDATGPPAAAGDAPPRAAAPKRPAAGRSGSRGSSVRQTRVLSARYIDIIRRDRIGMLLLFLVAPLLGAIDLIAWPRDILDPVSGNPDRTMTMLFLGTINPFLVGALSSVREIVKEAAIYRRERNVSLRVLPYLLSKIWVAFLFSLYNAAAFLLFRLLAVDMSAAGTSGVVALYVTLVLASLSGAMLGLLLSALARREEQVMMVLVLAVVVQIVFSGGILPLSNLGPAGKALGTVTSSKWIFQAEVAALNVKSGECAGPSLQRCRLPGLERFATDAERRVVVNGLDERFGEVYGAGLRQCWTALGLILAGMFTLLIVLQRSKDTT